jgi:hypothetical protein
VFQKSLSELNHTDIQGAVDAAVQEGSDVEFKEALPARSGDDPWLGGGNHIGDRARNEILAEIIAFANTYGGTLILGIKETTDKPARADRITPIPRCVELAERLRLQCRDCIDPQIPTIEIIGIPILKESGAGVVVVRLQRSRMAPHRHASTRECYKRHADRTEKMTMREIQDLTLNLERGLHVIETKLTERAENFSKAIDSFFAAEQVGFGVRLTLVPLSPIYLDKVHNVEEVRPPSKNFMGRMKGQEFELFNPWREVTQWRPIIRGSQAVKFGTNFEISITVMCDGQIQYSNLQRFDPSRKRIYYPVWLLSLVSNSLVAAERFRRKAGGHSVEYGLDLEIRTIGGDCPVGKYGGNDIYGPLGPLPEGRHIFPRYSVGSPETFQELLGSIERDFWNAAGHDWDDDGMMQVDFVKYLG